MTDIKMSDAFDLPVSGGDFTLAAMNKSTYVSMDRAAVIAINSYDLNQERIAELEEETKHLKQVIYNTAKVSFEAGACCPYAAFHEHAILFAKKITKEQDE